MTIASDLVGGIAGAFAGYYLGGFVKHPNIGAIAGAFVGAAAANSVTASAAAALPSPAGPTGPSSSTPVSASVMLADGTMPPTTVSAKAGLLTISVPGNNGGSIVSLSATSGYLLGDDVSGPVQKQAGTPPSSGTAGSNTNQVGWTFPDSASGASGSIVVVWYDAKSVAHSSTIPIQIL